MSEQWFWCLRHQQVERRGQCRADDRLGPYESPEAARDWRVRHDLREQDWEEADAQWAEPGDDQG